MIERIANALTWLAVGSALFFVLRSRHWSRETIMLLRTKPCPDCDGTGERPGVQLNGRPVPCYTCKGKKRVPKEG